MHGALDWDGKAALPMAEAAKRLVSQSHCTKAAAALVTLFNEPLELEVMRSRVAVELKTLRSKGLMEKEVFPAPFVKAIGHALAMRKPT